MKPSILLIAIVLSIFSIFPVSASQQAEKNHPNFNVQRLLSSAVTRNNIQFAELLLMHKADPNISDHFSPLERAESVEIAQLLVNHRADIHQKSVAHGNLLNHAAVHGKSAGIVAFLCNAGLDPNLKNGLGTYPLHTLFGFYTRNRRVPREEFRKIVALFLWAGTDPNNRDDHGQTALDVAKKELPPDQAQEIQTLMTIVPQLKAEKKDTYLQPIKLLLTQRITAEPARLVTEYTGDHLWCESYSIEIEKRLPQALQRANNSGQKVPLMPAAKRSRLCRIS